MENESTLTSYFFERSREEMVDDTIDETIDSEWTARRGLSSLEEEVLREQDRILFEADELMQRVFDGEFEEYWKSLRDPKTMHERFDSYRKIIEEHLAEYGDGRPPEEEWRERFHWGREWENAGDAGGEWEAPEESLQSDPLYRQAAAWAFRVHRLTTTLYYGERRKDADIFRVHTSATVVPAKILWAKAAFSMEGAAASSFALKGLRLSLRFLQRCAVALRAMKAKDVGHERDIRGCLEEAMELARATEEEIRAFEESL